MLAVGLMLTKRGPGLICPPGKLRVFGKLIYLKVIIVLWCKPLSEPEIVKVQLAREQYRITIPKEIAQKLKLRKGQPLWMTVQGEKIILEPVKR